MYNTQIPDAYTAHKQPSALNDVKIFVNVSVAINRASWDCAMALLLQ